MLERSEFEADPKPLGKERFAGCVDSCGGKILANVLTMTKVRYIDWTGLPAGYGEYLISKVSLLRKENIE